MEGGGKKGERSPDRLVPKGKEKTSSDLWAPQGKKEKKEDDGP